MIAGIDLGTKNLAVYDSDQMNYCISEDDFGSFEHMVFTLCDNMRSMDFVFIDFVWNEIHLPGRRLPQAKKYFIAGALSQVTNTYFVSPAQIRDMLGIPARVPKREVHNVAVSWFPEMKLLKNDHIRDAFLLYKFGEKYG